MHIQIVGATDSVKPMSPRGGGGGGAVAGAGGGGGQRQK